MKKLLLPTQVIESVNNQIQKDYPTITEKQRLKLFTVACEMWWIITDRHQSIIEKNQNQYGDASVYNLHINFHRNELYKFQIRIDKRVLKYNQILDLLVQSNVLEINHIYSSGRFTKSYRPHVDLCYNRAQLVELDLKWINQFFWSKQQLIDANPEYSKLIQDMYLTKVDLESYFDYLDEMKGQLYKTKQVTITNNNKTFKTNKLMDVYFDDRTIYRLKQKATKINLGSHFFKVADTGRIYSSLANLPKTAVKFLTLNGDPVIERDATNCQPLLLSSIINHDQYKEDCQSGVFYQKGAAVTEKSRDQFKVWSYANIFFNDKKVTSKVAQQLDSIYPGISNQINVYKETELREDQLWFRLQSLEAAIFVAVAKQLPFPVITRHDSLLIHPKWKNQVDELLKNEFKRLGLKVKLKQ